MKTLVRSVLLPAVLLSSLAFAQRPMERSGYLLDSSGQRRPTRLSLHAVLPYGHFRYGGFPIGVGAVFYIPLVANGFIPPVNDEFGLDFGADVVFFTGYRSVFSLWVPVSVLWTFHFAPTFAAYLKAGVALRIWPGEALPVYPDFVGAIGLNWMFAGALGLRVELGYPGLKVGLLFEF